MIMSFAILPLALLLWIPLLVTSHGFTETCEECDSVHYTNSWAVHIEDGDLDVANSIAKKHGFVNKGQIGSLPGYYHFIHKSTKTGRRHRRALDRTELLLSEEKVKWVEQQQVLERDKRSVIPDFVGLSHPAGTIIQDPLFKDQWYLNNIGQSSGPPSLDINILPVWARGITGKNVVVAVLDDGLDHTHPDLIKNYDPRASYDFNDYDNDPMPRSTDPNNCHGTKCAGEVAAEAGNGICGVGVAFNASIGGIRMLDGNTTDTIEGSALSYHNNYISIYSCAWGPKDDGKRFGRPGTLASKALELGTREGRGGLGSIFVWATGNGGLTDDDCNCDGYTTSIFTVSIGAISDHGLSTYYTESCASTLAVTYSGGSHREKKENKIITTTLNHECTDEFKGTSSAAPLAAGMIALMLEANPKLSWRDVQHIIVETALMTSPLDEGWRRNGAGKWFNQKFGFGRIDASQMVERSLAWDNVPEQRKCWGERSEGPWNIPESGTILVSANTTSCAETPLEIRSLEHVQLVISLKHRHRGFLSIELISPSGTRSQILKTRRNDKSNKGLKDWVFMSVHFWGEDPRGTWTLAVTDNDENTRRHYLLKTKHGDFEDATESLQDEMMGKPIEKGESNNTKLQHTEQDLMAATKENGSLTGESAGEEEGKSRKSNKKTGRKKQKITGKSGKKKGGKKEKHRKEKKFKEKHRSKVKHEREPGPIKMLEDDDSEGDSPASHNFGDSSDDSTYLRRGPWNRVNYGIDQRYPEEQRGPNEWLGRYNGPYRQKGPNIDEMPPTGPQAFEFKMTQNGSVIPESPGREFSDENVGLIDRPLGGQFIGANVYHGRLNDRVQPTPESAQADIIAKLKLQSRAPDLQNRDPMEERKGPSSDGLRVANYPTTTAAPQHAPPANITKQVEPSLIEEPNWSGPSSQTLIEGLVKSVLTEMLISIRNERNQSLFIDAVGKTLNRLGSNGSGDKNENVTVSLTNALKKGKALEKIDTLLTVLDKTKVVKNETSNQTRANDVVTDVLKVMHDILGAKKSNQQLDVFKKRISKFMEGSSNATKKLIEKLLKDLEPADGQDRSTDTITDAISLISAIFGQHRKKPRTRMKTALKNGLGNLFNIPREWNILLPGPDGGSIVVPYRSSGGLLADLKAGGTLIHPLETQVSNSTGDIENVKNEQLGQPGTSNKSVTAGNLSQNGTQVNKSNEADIKASDHATDGLASNNRSTMQPNVTGERKVNEKTEEEKTLEEKIAEEKKMVEKIAEERIIAEHIAEEKRREEKKLTEKKLGEKKLEEKKSEGKSWEDKKEEEDFDEQRKDEGKKAEDYRQGEPERTEEKVIETNKAENRKEDKDGNEILVSPKQLTVVENMEPNSPSWKKETPGDDGENYGERHSSEDMFAQNVEQMGIKGSSDVLKQENLETVHAEDIGNSSNEESNSVEHRGNDADTITVETNKMSDADIDTTVVRSEKLNEAASHTDRKDDGGLIDVEVVFDPKESMKKKKKASVMSVHHHPFVGEKEVKLHHQENTLHHHVRQRLPVADESDQENHHVTKQHDKAVFIPKTFTFNVDESTPSTLPELVSNGHEEEAGSKGGDKGQYFELPYKESDSEFKHVIPTLHAGKNNKLQRKTHQHLKSHLMTTKRVGHLKKKFVPKRHRTHRREHTNIRPVEFPSGYYKDGMPGLREALPKENRKPDGEEAANDLLDMDVSNTLPFMSVPIPQRDYNLLTSLVSSYPDSFVPEFLAANAVDSEPRFEERELYGSSDDLRQDVRRSYIDYPSDHDEDSDGRFKRDLILPDYTLDRANATLFEENLQEVIPTNANVLDVNKYAGGNLQNIKKNKAEEKRYSIPKSSDILSYAPPRVGEKDDINDINEITKKIRRGINTLPPPDVSTESQTSDDLQKDADNGNLVISHNQIFQEEFGRKVDSRAVDMEPVLSDAADYVQEAHRLQRSAAKSVDPSPSSIGAASRQSSNIGVSQSFQHHKKRRRRRSLDDVGRKSYLVRQKRDAVDDDNDLDDEGVAYNEPHVVKRSAILSELEPSPVNIDPYDNVLRINRRAADSIDEDSWQTSYRDNDENIVDEKSLLEPENDEEKGLSAISSLATEIKAGRRSNVRRVASLEGALRKKLLSMRKESGTVLKILQRVHHDISTGNAEDLRDLEIELAAMEDNDVRRQNLRRPHMDGQKRKHQKSSNYKRKRGKTHKKSNTKSFKTHSSKAASSDDVPKSEDVGQRLNPEEYYRYGTGNSGILEQWTLVFYGT